MGQCAWDYLQGDKNAVVTVYTNLEPPTKISGNYLFRSFKKMPEMEQYALQFCKGSVLDVGACAGCHSIILQQNGHNVTAIELSEHAANCLKARNIPTIHGDVMNLKNQQFDTILMLMNGLGLGGTIEKTTAMLAHLKTLLKPGGQIIGDSADIIESYREEDGSALIELTGRYYGIVDYQMQYKGVKGDKFTWLFIDYHTLADCAKKAGLQTELLVEGNTDNYLVRLTHSK